MQFKIITIEIVRNQHIAHPYKRNERNNIWSWKLSLWAAYNTLTWKYVMSKTNKQTNQTHRKFPRPECNVMKIYRSRTRTCLLKGTYSRMHGAESAHSFTAWGHARDPDLQKPSPGRKMGTEPSKATEQALPINTWLMALTSFCKKKKSLLRNKVTNDCSYLVFGLLNNMSFSNL